ncbi:MAG: response regulator [Reichenbachiella sp.]
MLNKTVNWIINVGILPSDSDDEKLRKSSLAIMSLPFAAAGLIWGIVYFLNGLLIPASIPFCYGILSCFSFIHFASTKKYIFFRNSQLTLILILPFLLQLTLGGFIQSSAVIIWGFICPLASLVFLETKKSKYWFFAYAILLVMAYFANNKMATYFNWALNDSFIQLFFLLNILSVSGLIFLVQIFFVGNQSKLKKAIEEQSEKLQELDSIKSRFFANISHEFRTPLTLIQGLVSKQIENQDRPPEKQDSQIMKRNADRLLQLINQLLDLSKLESGEIKLEVVRADIVDFTRKMTALFESMAADKNVGLKFKGSKVHNTGESILAYFDHDKLQKILTNLLSNAVKFTSNDGYIEVSVDLDQKNENVLIAISNTGETIPEENLKHLFDRFYQVDAKSTRQYEGTGIGLALVKELTDLHGGEVSVISENNKTTFGIALPLSDQSYDLESEQINDLEPLEVGIIIPQNISSKNETPITTSSEEKLVVLVVEDNPDLQHYIKDVLHINYHVIQAMDGLQGFELAKKEIPDLIVSDVMMPNMDGYELCQKLKTNEHTDHIPVILLTAKAAKEHKIEGLETGADDYLTKPFDKKELLIRIKNLIQLRAKLQEKFGKGSLIKPSPITVKSVQEKFLLRIREIIEENISNDQFSMDDLGGAINMSRSQVHRKLKALTNLSASNFVRNYRLHRAADLLSQSAGNVSEIAYQVGFNSQTYFSSSFTELFGCSPSEYKK